MKENPSSTSGMGIVVGKIKSKYTAGIITNKKYPGGIDTP
jgi:hypothetical protein